MDTDDGVGTQSAVPGPAIEELGAGHQYASMIRPVPDVLSPEAEAVWGRECARSWIQESPANRILTAVEGCCHGNSFRKQMAAMPEAQVPLLDDQVTSITVDRHAGEEAHVRRLREAKGECEDVGQEPPPSADTCSGPSGPWPAASSWSSRPERKGDCGSSRGSRRLGFTP